MSELETLLAELDRKLADPVNYANGEVMRRLGDEREHAARRLAEAEQAWLLLMDG